MCVTYTVLLWLHRNFTFEVEMKTTIKERIAREIPDFYKIITNKTKKIYEEKYLLVLWSWKKRLSKIIFVRFSLKQY